MLAATFLFFKFNTTISALAKEYRRKFRLLVKLEVNKKSVRSRCKLLFSIWHLTSLIVAQTTKFIDRSSQLIKRCLPKLIQIHLCNLSFSTPVKAEHFNEKNIISQKMKHNRFFFNKNVSQIETL